MDSLKHGQGIYYWTNETSEVNNSEQFNYNSKYFKYEGSWQNNTKCGNGTLLWTDGHKYVGHFKNNLMHGFGSIIFPENNNEITLYKYEGNFY